MPSLKYRQTTSIDLQFTNFYFQYILIMGRKTVNLFKSVTLLKKAENGIKNASFIYRIFSWEIIKTKAIGLKPFDSTHVAVMQCDGYLQSSCSGVVIIHDRKSVCPGFDTQSPHNLSLNDNNGLQNLDPKCRLFKF